MNGWMAEWIDELMNEWMTEEWMNEWMDDVWMDEWRNEWIHQIPVQSWQGMNGLKVELITGWMDEWMDELMNWLLNEWFDEWVNKWMKEWMNTPDTSADVPFNDIDCLTVMHHQCILIARHSLSTSVVIGRNDLALGSGRRGRSGVDWRWGKPPWLWV